MWYKYNIMIWIKNMYKITKELFVFRFIVEKKKI